MIASRVRIAVAALSLSAAGGTAILLHEGKVNRVHLDPVGIPTVCAGHTATVSHSDVGRVVSDATCERLLRQDTAVAERAVKRCVNVPVTQEQYDQLVDFTFNVGERNMCSSTLVRKLNAGDCTGAVKEFGRWVYARGVKLPGLVKRRQDNASAFATGCSTTGS